MMKTDRIGTTGRVTLLLAVGLSLALLVGGCAKYNTFFNAKRSFDQAEQVRKDAIKNNQDPPVPSGTQRADYENAIKKAQKLIEEYPGHSLTDDALFLQAKSYYRLQSYRMSIRKFDLLFSNFPATDYMEEALYLQSLNYLLLGSAAHSQELLERLAKNYPDSKFRSQTLKVSGDNAFALERWEEAEGFYADYLERFPDAEDWDRVGQKLGRVPLGAGAVPGRRRHPAADGGAHLEPGAGLPGRPAAGQMPGPDRRVRSGRAGAWEPRGQGADLQFGRTGAAGPGRSARGPGARRRCLPGARVDARGVEVHPR